MLGASVIHHETRFKVVERVEKEIDAGDVVFNVGWIDIIYDSFDLNGGIHAAKFGFGSGGLRKIVTDVLFVKQGLPLQVRKFDEVAIDEAGRSRRRRERFDRR